MDDAEIIYGDVPGFVQEVELDVGNWYDGAVADDAEDAGEYDIVADDGEEHIEYDEADYEPDETIPDEPPEPEELAE